MDSGMLNKVIETYRCLLSCRKKMPGMRLEDAFSSQALRDLETEYGWLLSQQALNKDHPVIEMLKKLDDGKAPKVSKEEYAQAARDINQKMDDLSKESKPTPDDRMRYK